MSPRKRGPAKSLARHRGAKQSVPAAVSRALPLPASDPKPSDGHIQLPLAGFAGEEYAELLRRVKERVREAQVRAAASANAEMLLLYWDIGRQILERQGAEGYGTRVVDRLSVDLRREFPEMKGLSPRNLKYMRAFADAWPDREVVQAPLAQLPWYHHLTLLEKVAEAATRLFYVRAAVENGWSRNTLVLHIERQLHRRQGTAITNFARTLAAPGSDLAREALKDPYVFDFLGLADDALERDVEQALVAHIRDFLVEMGVGFAYVGQQVRLEVGGDEFFVDLLFYHLKLRCYVVIELKAGDFKPAFAGQLNFYLTTVDEQLRHADDKPTIGLLLCKQRNKVVVEYALRDVAKPIGVAEWKTKLVESLPRDLAASLPTVEALEAELKDLPGPGDPKE